MLELRQMLGRSSTAKYRKIQLMEHEGRVFDNLLYHGAAPGRWTGASFQLHNLPRASVPDPEAVIDKFNNFEPIDDPVNVAKALIRPMIYSGPSSSLVVSDYKAIETCNLFWLAGDHETCDAIRQGKDLYVEMAAYMYQIRPDQVTKRQRQIGKIIILGCGYQMGAKRFKDTCAQWGIEISMSEALAAVEAYRAKYPLVKRMWKMLALAAKNAIQYPGNRYDYRDCSFRMVRDRAGNRWLLITLPSGRNMFYMEPYLEEDEWGMVPGHYGINPYTKKWSRRRLIPGRIIENIDQGLARDIMAIGLVNIDDNMPQINLIGTVHDEAIGEIEDRFIHEGLLAEFNNNLCRMPEWANGLPLSAEGYIAKRYRK